MNTSSITLLGGRSAYTLPGGSSIFAGTPLRICSRTGTENVSGSNEKPFSVNRRFETSCRINIASVSRPPSHEHLSTYKANFHWYDNVGLRLEIDQSQNQYMRISMTTYSWNFGKRAQFPFLQSRTRSRHARLVGILIGCARVTEDGRINSESEALVTIAWISTYP